MTSKLFWRRTGTAMLLGLMMFAGNALAGVTCRIYTEWLPAEVGGGYVEFEICCWDGWCYLSWLKDYPTFKPRDQEN